LPRKRDSLIVPVDVYRGLYNRVSKKATEQNTSIRRLVNDLLAAALNKYEFLDHAFPYLRLDGIGEKSLYIKDFSAKNQDVTAEVRIKEAFKLWCSLCNSDSCKHVHFSEIIPDIGRIILFQDMNANITHMNKRNVKNI
jgi:hypothetical protein